MKLTGWCRYFDRKNGTRYYDIETFAHTRKVSKELWAYQIKGLNPEWVKKTLKETKYERVTITINSNS